MNALPHFPSAVAAGIRYYTAFPAEIDAWIDDSQAASEQSELEWQGRQTLLS